MIVNVEIDRKTCKTVVNPVYIRLVPMFLFLCATL